MNRYAILLKNGEVSYRIGNCLADVLPGDYLQVLSVDYDFMATLSAEDKLWLDTGIHSAEVIDKLP